MWATRDSIVLLKSSQAIMMRTQLKRIEKKMGAENVETQNTLPGSIIKTLTLDDVAPVSDLVIIFELHNLDLKYWKKITC